ncbi:2Fe-2S iron-sulfur cluster-binding protein [Rubrivirga marina]|uniref:(2Fe-2S)-binding protein n=1 Tax=Rubrivirga marina TaxID=1196024 RepID=A0A271IWR8_9BACT|nr:2Fe-2S iron-sulfur cluster-binding protein [Rubrivirga marina]PAP75165.1 (2Fe-2S)-binding protein [Rubrivirga marina]
MPQVIIDGKAHEFEPGQKLLQLCLDEGTEIPHFCYHPSLSVPANCRQCLVKAGTPMMDRETKEPVLDDDGNPKINYFPKLMPSCALDVTEGMVVHTQNDSEEVAAAQADNLEIMLANHPLDCPICDQAGQCPLQIQAYKYGPEGSRFEFEKVHKPKRVQLGPNVVLDAERCINCTRCTRFTAEITETHQLTIINRGDKNHPMTAPGQVFDDAYSMCTADICPVGALTEDYFRFQARVWEMAHTPTVSDFGGKGINVDVWTKNNQVLRITPRENLDVNEYWMPDAARLVFKTYNEDRASGPQIHGRPTTWEAAAREAGQLLKDAGSNVLFLGSAYATVEDNYLLQRLAEAVGAEAPRFIDRRGEWDGDDWLHSSDPAPNTAGCERLGLQPVDPALLAGAVASASLVYVLQDDPVAAGVLSAADLGDTPVVLHSTHTTNQTSATVTLPITMSVETLGTYVNEDGRAQLLRPAKMVKAMNRSLLMALGTGQSRNDRVGTPFDRWHDEANQVDCLPGWATIPQVAKEVGFDLSYKSPAKIMDEVAARPEFSGATHGAMSMLGVPLETADAPAELDA